MYLVGRYLLFLGLLPCVFGARILGVFRCPSYSHQIAFRALYTELAQRGHEVIAVTPTPLRHVSVTNITEIDMSHLYKYRPSVLNSFGGRTWYPHLITNVQLLVNNFTEEILINEDFKKLYHNAKNEHFDLILVEGLGLLSAALGYVFKAPCISMFTMEAPLDIYSALGGIIHPSVYGGLLIDFDYPVSIWHKIQNTYHFLYHKFYLNYVNRPVIDQLAKKYFGDDFPSTAELERNISMIFVTRNIAMNPVRPMPPNFIELDFLHVQKPKPIPRDLKQLLDSSIHGVVYFSLGTIVNVCLFSQKIKTAIFKGLSSLPYTVLLKLDCDEMPILGENVIVRKWFPQQDVLAHPNIKVFVTQGGYQSCEEAVARAVPLVGIPAIFDQEDNVDKLVKAGVAVKLSLDDLIPESLKRAIIEVAKNNKYSIKMKELHDVCFDQPMTGLERAVWWTEYVIRNKGAPALKSLLADVPLYEYLLLDVILVVLLGLAVTTFVLKRIISVILKKSSTVFGKRKMD